MECNTKEKTPKMVNAYTTLDDFVEHVKDSIQQSLWALEIFSDKKFNLGKFMRELNHLKEFLIYAAEDGDDDLKVERECHKDYVIEVTEQHLDALKKLDDEKYHYNEFLDEMRSHMMFLQYCRH